MRYPPASLLFLALWVTGPLSAENWPQWRGPRLDGTSLESRLPPVSPTRTNLNIAWRTPLPGHGHASPVVWEKRLFTAACLPETEERTLLCLDRDSGALLWRKTVLTAPLEGKHSLNSHASSTPATDGERIFSAFLEVRKVVVAAHDFAGNLVWLKRPGAFGSRHGFCSSPILFEDKVIVNCDHDGDGYVVAMARSDGRELWRIDRPNKTRSYCVPLIRTLSGKPQMVMSGSKCVASYDPRNGGLNWIIDGPTEQFVASPVFNDRTGLLYVTGGYPDHHLLAIDPAGSGNVTQTHIKWRTNRGVAYVPSPITIGDYLLIVSDSGVAHCFEAANGKLLWQERVGEHHASLMAGMGLVYLLNDEGVLRVIRPGPRFDQVARLDLGEKTFASPAASDGRIFLRGDRSMFCISE